METSYSSLSTFRNCHRKFLFRSIHGLEPKHEGPEISIGKAIHEAFDLFFNGKSHHDCLKYISDKFDQAISTADAWAAEDLTIGKYIALGMWQHYPFANIQFDRVYPEQKFKVPVPGFPEVYYVGYLDGLVVDQGRYWIREVKTTGLDLYQLEKRADVSYQASGYIWAMQNILRERVHGAYFDMIRKPLMRKGNGETALDFAERNFKHYQDAGNHSKLFRRHHSYRSELQIQQFEEDLKWDVEDLLQSMERERYQRNPDNCFMYGRECPYKKICWMPELPDEDTLNVLYRRRESREASGKTLTIEDSDLEI